MHYKLVLLLLFSNVIIGSGFVCDYLGFFLPFICDEEEELSSKLDFDPREAMETFFTTECTNVTGTAMSQLFTMKLFYYSTGNKDNSGPLFDRGWTNSCNPCDWQGVSCHSDRVISIDCSGEDLTSKLIGSIPQELSNINTLTSLRLNKNAIGGTIPINLSRFLFNVDLSENNLIGPIPNDFGEKGAMLTLDLHDNQLNNTIPTSLGELSYMRILNLSNNLLSGEIPSELSKLVNLATLQLQWNNLIGTVPEDFCTRVIEIKADCNEGDPPQVECSCCDTCCENESDSEEDFTCGDDGFWF